MPQIAPNIIIPNNGGKGEGVSSSSIVPAVTYREPYSVVNQTGDSDPLSGRRILSNQTFTNGALPGEGELTLPLRDSGVIGPPTLRVGVGLELEKFFLAGARETDRRMKFLYYHDSRQLWTQIRQDFSSILKPDSTSDDYWSQPTDKEVKSAFELAGHALSAENSFIFHAYKSALEKVKDDVILDGIVGSLSLGVATLTHKSDIDATVLVKPGKVIECSSIINTYLSERGISPHISFLDQESLIRSPDAELTFFALKRFFTGMQTVGDTQILLGQARSMIDTMSFEEFAAQVDKWTKMMGPYDPIEKYTRRVIDYARRFKRGQETIFQQQPELFYDSALFANAAPKPLQLREPQQSLGKYIELLRNSYKFQKQRTGVSIWTQGQLITDNDYNPDISWINGGQSVFLSLEKPLDQVDLEIMLNSLCQHYNDAAESLHEEPMKLSFHPAVYTNAELGIANKKYSNSSIQFQINNASDKIWAISVSHATLNGIEQWPLVYFFPLMPEKAPQVMQSQQGEEKGQYKFVQFNFGNNTPEYAQLVLQYALSGLPLPLNKS